jgi:hypothetical protein
VGNDTGLASPSCSGKCLPGTYCPPASMVARPCPAGTFGYSKGLSTSDCSGPCPEGTTDLFFCSL